MMDCTNRIGRTRGKKMNAEELDKMAEEAYAKDVQYIGMSANITYKLGFKAGYDKARMELQKDLKHKKIAIQNRKTRIKNLEKRLEQATKLLAKWVELFKPKCDSILPPPIQVDTEKFLKE